MTKDLKRPAVDTNYLLQHTNAVNDWLSERSAQSHAAFILPYLQPTDRLLDCGCGPGSITKSFCAFLHRGCVVGIDADPECVARAIADLPPSLAHQLSFERASVHKLPFPDEHFDVAFAHSLFMHIRNPTRALREIRRVLKRGGYLALSEPDISAAIYSPHYPAIARVMQTLDLVLCEAGGRPDRARSLPTLVSNAGFQITKSLAYIHSYGPPEGVDVPRFVLEQYFSSSTFVRVAERAKIADKKSLKSLKSAIERWAKMRSAFYALPFCCVVATNGPRHATQ